MDTNVKTVITRLSDTTWAFEQGMVRCFYIAGADRAVLLDTGVAPENLFQLMMPLADLPLMVINTHGDGDHTANNALFPSVYAHPAEAAVLTAHGEVPYVIKSLEDGTVIELGGVTLEVLHMPGHTPGSICLLDRTNKVLYSGDTVSYGPVFLFGEGRDPKLYGESLRKLQAMAAEGIFDSIYCCHGSCPVDVTVIDELLAALEGALNGSIEGVEAKLGFGPVEGLKTYSYGRSGIYMCL